MAAAEEARKRKRKKNKKRNIVQRGNISVVSIDSDIVVKRVRPSQIEFYVYTTTDVGIVHVRERQSTFCCGPQ